MKKLGIAVILFTFFILVGFLYFLNGSKIIDGEYDKLTIMKVENVVYVIEDKDLINSVVRQINTSPRVFNADSPGFYHDTMYFGILIFEGNSEKKTLAFKIPDGNVITKYWEVETGFDFAEDVNDNIRRKIY
ncbi:hypothetical protein [Bacillus sp. SG-1]|uniref:hypothetical protein n=1 Tax=Bacillus sp. SG-1 TaxID=161544 RepID=UPI0001544EE1|nr:hypothetical protein [Bacillus sp. SG-1]EDL64511.1 hypothetical protein BSG1_08231 [Bacillus sp. SG-1]